MAKQVQFRWFINWPHTEEAKGGCKPNNNHIQVKNFPIVEPTFIAKKLGIIRDINDALFSRLISNDFQIRKSTRYDKIACVITVRKGFFVALPFCFCPFLGLDYIRTGLGVTVTSF